MFRATINGPSRIGSINSGFSDLFLVQTRNATKKAQGSSKNGRDSNPKYRGIKRNNLQAVTPGAIILRQKGNKWHAGDNTGCGRDFTIYSKVYGVVKFERAKEKNTYNRIHVIKDERFGNEFLFYPRVGTNHTQEIIERIYPHNIPELVTSKQALLELNNVYAEKSN